MDENNSIQLFEDRKIRTVWDEEQEEWYFSVVDVIAVLTDSSNPTDYLKKMRKRDEQLARYLGTNCPQVAMIGATGKNRKVLAATTEQLLRIIQSIPSPKAEPFKLWLAQVGRERIEETIDPEQAIDRALETYQKKGYDTDWIHQRLLSIRVRNELTAEWQERGVQQGKEYAILTDEITKAWSGMTTRQYKKLKGLKKENLRDNMSTMEIVLNIRWTNLLWYTSPWMRSFPRSALPRTSSSVSARSITLRPQNNAAVSLPLRSRRCDIARRCDCRQIPVSRRYFGFGRTPRGSTAAGNSAGDFETRALGSVGRATDR